MVCALKEVMILGHQWNASIFKLIPRCNPDTDAAIKAFGQVEHV